MKCIVCLRQIIGNYWTGPDPSQPVCEKCAEEEAEKSGIGRISEFLDYHYSNTGG
jgi:hypothetical protein